MKNSKFFSCCPVVGKSNVRSWWLWMSNTLPSAELELSLIDYKIWVFISVFYQLDAQNLFYSKFYFMPLHVSSTYAHHKEVKISLHNLWYHPTSPIDLLECMGLWVRHQCDDTRTCIMQYWPPDDEHMCSKHVEAWNKTYCKTNFVHQVSKILR